MSDRLKTETPSMASILQQASTNALKETHTTMPGVIVSFDPETQLAAVQPSIRRMFNTGSVDKPILTPVDIPQLVDVLVVFPRAAGFALTFPVAPGDECLLSFCERDISAWSQSGGVVLPPSKRMHNLTDAVALVGISSQPNKIKNFDAVNVQLRDDTADTKITITPDDEIRLETPQLITVNAPTTEWTGDINLTGNITQTGDITQTGSIDQTGDTVSSGTITGNTDVIASGISGKSHTHGGVDPGPGSTGVPQ